MKEVNFVYSRNKLDFKKFIKTSEYSDVISYHDIITKLVKNDKNNERPSGFVVNSYLRKKILKSMSDDSSNKIIYALKDLDIDIINSIKGLMSDSCEHEINFNLTIIQHKKLIFTDADRESVKILDWLKSVEIKEL